MKEKEDCGDYYIFEDEEGWWIIQEKNSNKIIGKFQSKEDALEKIAFVFQDDEGRSDSESVC